MFASYQLLVNHKNISNTFFHQKGPAEVLLNISSQNPSLRLSDYGCLQKNDSVDDNCSKQTRYYSEKPAIDFIWNNLIATYSNPWSQKFALSSIKSARKRGEAPSSSVSTSSVPPSPSDSYTFSGYSLLQILQGISKREGEISEEAVVQLLFCTCAQTSLLLYGGSELLAPPRDQRRQAGWALLL